MKRYEEICPGSLKTKLRARIRTQVLWSGTRVLSFQLDPLPLQRVQTAPDFAKKYSHSHVSLVEGTHC